MATIDTSPSERLLLRAYEARALLGIGERKFRRWVNAGIIPCYRDPATGWRYYSREQIIEAAARLGKAS